jgi:hypothetical protein
MIHRTANFRVRALMMTATLAFTACQAKKGSGSKDTASSTEMATSSTSVSTSTGTTGDPTSIAAYPTTVGTRNFDQINATMESVTGVMGNSTVISRFTALKGQLPSDNDVKSFSFSAQGAITVLAAEYCTALVTNSGGKYATQLMVATGNFNVGALPAVAFTATSSATLSRALIVKFWGSNYAASSNAATAQQGVIQLMMSLVTGQPNTTTTTKNAVIGACTSVLASAPVSVY